MCSPAIGSYICNKFTLRGPVVGRADTRVCPYKNEFIVEDFMDRLLEDLQYIKGVGPKRSRQLNRLGLDTIFDLLWNIPRAYFNRANVNRITELKDGEAASIRGKICSAGTSRTRGGMTIFKALVEDETR